MNPLLHPTDPPKNTSGTGRSSDELTTLAQEGHKIQNSNNDIEHFFLHSNSLNCFLGRSQCGERKGRPAWTRATASQGQRRRLVFVHFNSTQAQRSYKNLLQGLGNCISGGTDSACFRWVNKCSKYGRKSEFLRGHAVPLSDKALKCLWSWERSGAVWSCGHSDSKCNLRTTLIKFVSSLRTCVL